MNEGIAMMLSILIVMFGYLVFKILTDQSQSRPPPENGERKEGQESRLSKITGICDHWTQKILQTKICDMRTL